MAYRKTILVSAAACSALALWGAVGVNFEYNLLKLQAKGVESVTWEERILAEAGRSGIAAFASAGSLPELEAKHEEFERLSTVAKVESVLMLYPEGQTEKIAVIRGLAEPLEGVTLRRPRPWTCERCGPPSRHCATGSPARWAPLRGEETPPARRALLAQVDDVTRPARRRRGGGGHRARISPGCPLPGFRRQARRLPQEPRASAGGARRGPAGAARALCRRERPLPDPRAAGRRHLGAGERRALRH